MWTLPVRTATRRFRRAQQTPNATATTPAATGAETAPASAGAGPAGAAPIRAAAEAPRKPDAVGPTRVVVVVVVAAGPTPAEAGAGTGLTEAETTRVVAETVAPVAEAGTDPAVETTLTVAEAGTDPAVETTLTVAEAGTDPAVVEMTLTVAVVVAATGSELADFVPAPARPGQRPAQVADPCRAPGRVAAHQALRSRRDTTPRGGPRRSQRSRSVGRRLSSTSPRPRLRMPRASVGRPRRRPPAPPPSQVGPDRRRPTRLCPPGTHQLPR
ncbi:hypothetical protein FHR38_001532 [Micromonospora polyrhachis]|uniref:Uncharacterized protein n=1 Tax=Micromonospora polyrhachis TaxID=1282883 RepID=A0A7W7WNQ1_9ACTN|nr:hypothetical protein [Micromonospora polyrhachis]